MQWWPLSLSRDGGPDVVQEASGYGNPDLGTPRAQRPLPQGRESSWCTLLTMATGRPSAAQAWMRLTPAPNERKIDREIYCPPSRHSCPLLRRSWGTFPHE